MKKEPPMGVFAAERALKALAGKARLRIVKLLQSRSLCVCELSHILRISQPAVSRHLKRLMEAGIVAVRQEGWWSSYALRRQAGGAGALICCVRSWLNRDPIVIGDRKVLRKTDRRCLAGCGDPLNRGKRRKR